MAIQNLSPSVLNDKYFKAASEYPVAYSEAGKTHANIQNENFTYGWIEEDLDVYTSP